VCCSSGGGVVVVCVCVCCSVLCSTVKELAAKLAASTDHNDDLSTESVSSKCSVLNQKLDALIKTLHEESQAAADQENAVSANVNQFA